MPADTTGIKAELPAVLLRAGLLAAAVLWVFSPAWHGGWIWDDDAEVAGNAALRLSWSALGRIWFAPAGADYFPLKTTVQWLAWHLWGPHPLGYHLLSLVFHLASALLLWRVFWRLGLKWAWWGALVFAIHPLAVESVAWIAELKNTLSLLLLCLAINAWLDFFEGSPAGRGALGQADSTTIPGGRHGSVYYAFAWFWFAAALLAKSTVVMFPVMILLHCWWRNGRIGRKDWLAAAPFFALSLGLGLVTIWFQSHRAIVGQDLAIGGGLARCAASGLAVLFYLGKFIWPAGLIPVYPRWAVVPPSPVQLLPWVGVLGLGGILWARRGRWGRGSLFGLGWFVLNLLPVLGWIPMSYLRLSWVADHFVYLPMIGLAGLTAAAAERLGDGWAQRRSSLRWPLAAAGGLFVALLGWRAHAQAQIYRDDRSFWTVVQQRNPSAWIAANNLGLILLRSGHPAEAAAQFRSALATTADQAELHNNLGDALAALGRPSEAVPEFQASLRLRPELVDAEVNLGSALGQLGRLQDSAAHYRRALQLRPDQPQAHLYLGLMLERMGDGGGAAEQLRLAAGLDPQWAEPHYQLGSLWGNLGRMPEAIAEYRQAVRLKPDYAEAWANLGLALAVNHDPAAALAPLQTALRLRPNYAEAHAYLGFALAADRRYEEAVAQYEQALSLGPSTADLRYQLAAALRALGRLTEARHQLELMGEFKP